MARILIVEPDGALHRLIELQLRQLEHDVVECFRNSFDLALIEPADRDGFAIAVVLRELRPEIPIVFVSNVERSPETAALHPEAHLVKPYRLNQLRQAVASALERRGAPPQAPPSTHGRTR